jgi:hypothetical protein
VTRHPIHWHAKLFSMSSNKKRPSYDGLFTSIQEA